MMARRTLFAIPALALVILGGCASPSSRFYTLSAIKAAGGVSAPASTLSVAVGPVSVPASVDRPEIVVSTGANQVHLEELDRWASPLQDEISRTVAENLVALLGTPHVTQSPRTLNRDAAYRVSIEVQRFDSVPGTSAILDAVWTVRRAKDDKSTTGRTTAREPLSTQGYDALAAAHSRALARMSREIADAVRTLEHAPR